MKIHKSLLLLICVLLLFGGTSCHDPANGYVNSGRGKLAKGNLDGALADFTKAIELKPDYSQAYYERGTVRYKQKNLDGALSDFTKAIELKADVARSYGDRGNVKGAQGDAEGAMADYSKSIELDPTNTFVYHLRGFLYYDTHESTNALADLRKPASLDTSERDYTHFYIWLARARLGEEAAAMDELEDYRQNRKGGPTDDWAGSVLAYLAGQLSESELFKAAESEDVTKTSEQQCEAYFYAGSKRLIDGDKMTAANYFQKCLATGHVGFSEYQSAAAELKFLKEAK